MPPEHLLKASLLIALYSMRSERQFCERLTYDMLLRWFLDLNIRGGSFDQSTFAKNRTRLLAHEVTGLFFGAVVSEARRQRLLSEEYFSVDGTLLEAWASLKSVRPRDEKGDPPAGEGGRNPWKDLRGERRSNATHVSTTDPEALLARKVEGQAYIAKRCATAGTLVVGQTVGYCELLAGTSQCKERGQASADKPSKASTSPGGGF